MAENLFWPYFLNYKILERKMFFTEAAIFLIGQKEQKKHY